MNISVLEKTYSIYKFRTESELPEWIYSSEFYSITKTIDEVSLLAVQSGFVPGEVISSRDWRILKVEGPLDLSLTGVIAGISSILAEKNIPIFTVSTYNTDYFLVRQYDLERCVEALKNKGYNFPSDGSQR